MIASAKTVLTKGIATFTDASAISLTYFPTKYPSTIVYMEKTHIAAIEGSA